MNELKVAIVGGTGNLGSALALRLGAPGVKIIIGSRDAEKARNAVETLRPKLRAGEMFGTTNRDAVKDADFIVIAVPYEGHAQMVSDLKGQLSGKILIDTVVPLNKVKPFVPAAGSALQEAQQILDGEAPVIGALHNISAVDLGDVEDPERHAPQRSAATCFPGMGALLRWVGQGSAFMVVGVRRALIPDIGV